MLAMTGGFRTAVIENMQSGDKSVELNADYKGGVPGQVLSFIDLMLANPTVLLGDPAKLGTQLVEVVEGTGMATSLEINAARRVLLGPDAVRSMESRIKAFRRDLKATQSVAKSTDFDLAD